MPALLSVVALTATGCRAPTTLDFAQRIVSPTDLGNPRDAYAVAWLSEDRLAVATFDDLADSALTVIDLQGNEVAGVPVPERDRECIARSFGALSRLPAGQLGFASVCEQAAFEPPYVSEFFAYDPTVDILRSLGSATEPPANVTWAPDMARALYTAEGSLCATLYEHDARDGPLELDVTVNGQSIPLGEDLASAADRCTQVGNAAFPAYAPDGESFAVMARSTEDAHGQDRIDIPWSILVVANDGSSMSILEGIVNAAGLDWLAPDTLAFAGEVNGAAGLWAVRRDGTGLTQVSDKRLVSIEVAPHGPWVSALEEELTADGKLFGSILLLDLGEIVSASPGG